MSEDRERLEGVKIYTIKRQVQDEHTENLIKLNQRRLADEEPVVCRTGDYLPVNRTEDIYQPLVFQWLFLKALDAQDSSVEELLIRIEEQLSLAEIDSEKDILEGRIQWSKRMTEASEKAVRSQRLFDDQVEILRDLKREKQKENAKLNIRDRDLVDELLSPIFSKYLTSPKCRNRKPSKGGFADYLLASEDKDRPKIGKLKIGRPMAIEAFGRMNKTKNS